MKLGVVSKSTKQLRMGSISSEKSWKN